MSLSQRNHKEARRFKRTFQLPKARGTITEPPHDAKGYLITETGHQGWAFFRAGLSLGLGVETAKICSFADDMAVHRFH
jgi:hypothetical protein